MATQKSLLGLNIINASKDLTQVAWSKEGNVTATFDQVGLGGGPNDATLLSCSSTTAAVTSQTITPTPNTPLCLRIFTKIEANTLGTRIILSPDVGTNTTFVVGRSLDRACAASNANNASFMTSWNSPYSGWVEIVMSIIVPAGSSNIEIQIAPRAASVTSGSTLQTGNVTIGNIEAYDNTEMWEVIGQNAVFT